MWRRCAHLCCRFKHWITLWHSVMWLQTAAVQGVKRVPVLRYETKATGAQASPLRLKAMWRTNQKVAVPALHATAHSPQAAVLKVEYAANAQFPAVITDVRFRVAFALSLACLHAHRVQCGRDRELRSAAGGRVEASHTHADMDVAQAGARRAARHAARPVQLQAAGLPFIPALPSRMLRSPNMRPCTSRSAAAARACLGSSSCSRGRRSSAWSLSNARRGPASTRWTRSNRHCALGTVVIACRRVDQTTKAKQLRIGNAGLGVLALQGGR